MPEIEDETAEQDAAMTKTKAATSKSRAPKSRATKPRAATAGIVDTVRDKLGEHAGTLRAQASEKAHDYAVQGKDRATELLDGLVELVDSAVGALDRNFGESDLGAGASDYARRAAGALSGFTDNLREKDVDELIEDAREAIRNNPAIAIGAAAAIGFVLARIVKAGADEGTGARA